MTALWYGSVYEDVCVNEHSASGNTASGSRNKGKINPEIYYISTSFLYWKKDFFNFLEYCRLIHIISGLMDNTSTHTHT